MKTTDVLVGEVYGDIFISANGKLVRFCFIAQTTPVPSVAPSVPIRLEHPQSVAMAEFLNHHPALKVLEQSF